MQGRTTFMISHHLHTLRHCNMILVLEHGQIVEVTQSVAELSEAAVS